MSQQNEQYKSRDFFAKLDICSRLVAEKHGKSEIEKWANMDYLIFANHLFKQTGVQISASTLKRIFGKLKTTERYYPQKATRDALAQYAGFIDWDDFEEKNPLPESSNPQNEEQIPEPVDGQKETVDFSSSGKTKKFRLSRLSWAMIFFLTVSGVALIVWQKKSTPFPSDKIKLICRNAEGETPHSASFQIQVAKGTQVNEGLSIDFGDGKSERKIPSTLAITHYYDVPGRYYATLKYNGSPIDTIPVYLRTNGWTATGVIQNDTIRSYPIPITSLNKNGELSVSGLEAQKAGIDTNRTFFIHFVNTKPLSINADNFELTLQLKTSAPRSGVRCSQANITIYGEKSQHAAVFIKPGCVSWASLQFSDFNQNGQVNDLSFLGADLTNGGKIVLQVRNKKAALLVNNKTVFETPYKFLLKSIYGLRISFAGIGMIEDVELKDLGTGESVYYL